MDDIIRHIATFNEEAWFKLTLIPSFRQYAYSDAGIREYIKLFTKINIYANGDQVWYYEGERHCVRARDHLFKW